MAEAAETKPAEAKHESSVKNLAEASSKSKSRVSIHHGMRGLSTVSLKNIPTTSRLRMRRKSYGFGSVAGIRPLERSSQIGLEFKRPILTYLPTYQLEPHIKFHPTRATEVVDECLTSIFAGHKYNVQETPALALRCAGEIMKKLKQMHFNRYRILSIVTVGQKRAQSYNNGINLLWDQHRDNYIDIHRESTQIFIQVTVFGIYFD